MKNLSQGNKGIKALAKNNPALVEDRFGYNVPNFQMGGFTIPDFSNIDFDYIRDVLGIDVAGENETELSPEELAAARLARGYGSSGGSGGIGWSNYTGTTPGASISIDARDETPDAYRFYPSEVSKLYSQMKGVPFSPLVAPPKEATYIDSLQPRKKIASQLYAKDGTYVNSKDDFPEREELVTGPGGEKGDKIPAMLSDGEFIFNSAAVRGMGIMAGASPDDEYEQRLMGARKMYEFQKEAEEMAKRYK